MREINERVPELATRFQEQLLEMTRERAVIVEDVELLDGLNPDRIAAAKEAAEERGHSDSYLLSITNTTRVPVLTSLNNRDLRQRVWEASAYRGLGEDGGGDTRDIAPELAAPRAERAAPVGCQTTRRPGPGPRRPPRPDATPRRPN